MSLSVRVKAQGECIDSNGKERYYPSRFGTFLPFQALVQRYPRFRKITCLLSLLYARQISPCMSPPASSDGIVVFACPCSSLSLLALSLFCCTRARQPHVDRAEARVKSARVQEDSLSYGTTMTICRFETGSDIGELRLPGGMLMPIHTIICY